jgi:hypothetical protein
MEFSKMKDAGTAALPPGAGDKLREFLGAGRRLGRVAQLPVLRRVEDHCDKFVALDGDGRPSAFVVVSPASHPHAVSDAAERALLMQGALGPALGDSVLLPWLVGKPDGISYSITPYCRPMSAHRLMGRWERWRLAPRALAWLERVVRDTVRPVAAHDLASRVAGPLHALMRETQLEPALRAAAQFALDELANGAWRPATVVAHNDFWWANFVHRDASAAPSFPYFVIDWGGGVVAGAPIYDLMRLSMSLNVSPSALRRHVAAHAALLGCRPRDAMGYLLVALGTLSLDRGEWPLDQFLQTARTCFLYLAEALEIRD